MKSWKKDCLCAGVVLTAMVIGMVLCPPVFYLNDDVTMRSILSGAYTGTPDGHAVYMMYPLSGVLALLYRLMGFVPWMEVFLAACIGACMVLIARRVRQPLLGCLTALALCMPFCLYMHYTLVAALVAGTGIFLLAVGENRKYIAVILLVIAYLIRSQVGLLCLPFALAAMVWRILTVGVEERKRELSALAKQIAVLAGGFVLCFLVNSLCYSTAEWKEYLAYNDSRTLLYDYTDFLSTDYYGQHYEEYGMTREEYQLLYSYNTMLDAELDAARMEEIAVAVSRGMKQNVSLTQGLKDCAGKYYIQLRYHDMPYNMVWIAGYLVLAVLLVWRRSWLRLGVLGLLGLGRSSVWMYLIWQGRFPERVSLSLYVMELLLLLGMGVTLVAEREGVGKRVRAICLGGAVICVGALCCFLWMDAGDKAEERGRIQQEWSVLQAYCEESPERLYLVDVFSTVEYAGMQYERDGENMMILGGWMSANPLALERFAVLGAEDGAEALKNDASVSFFIKTDRDTGWLEEYLQSRFGDCSLEEVAEISVGADKAFAEYRMHLQ